MIKTNIGPSSAFKIIPQKKCVQVVYTTFNNEACTGTDEANSNFALQIHNSKTKELLKNADQIAYTYMNWQIKEVGLLVGQECVKNIPFEVPEDYSGCFSSHLDDATGETWY